MRSIHLTTLAISASLLLPGAAMAQADTPEAPIVVFSTDYGLGVVGGATNGPDRHASDVDDAYAVALALTGADVRAVVSTFGNDKAQPSAESARRGLEALGHEDASDLVVTGSEGFLDAEAVTFVPDGDGAVPVFCLNDGVERLGAVLEAHDPGTVTLLAIGPFTDAACLQRADPDAFAKLAQIIALVGSTDGTPVLQGISVVDFNFAMDPTALGEVISGDHGVPITFLMFEVSQLGSLSNEIIDGWASSDDPGQRYYGLATQPHAAYWDAIFSETDGQALFDAHTAYYLVQPDAYACEDGMLATATVGGYPDTSASTTKNSLTVVSSSGTPVAPSAQADGSTHTFTGPVRGCTAFATDDGQAAFEGAVAASIVSPAE